MRYQSNRPKRQFLAGVKCPHCGEMDKVVQVQRFEPESDEYIECTECGYTERRPTPTDLTTIQATHALPASTPVAMPAIDLPQPIRFKFT